MPMTVIELNSQKQLADFTLKRGEKVCFVNADDYGKAIEFDNWPFREAWERILLPPGGSKTYTVYSQAALTDANVLEYTYNIFYVSLDQPPIPPVGPQVVVDA